MNIDFPGKVVEKREMEKSPWILNFPETRLFVKFIFKLEAYVPWLGGNYKFNGG